MYCESVSVLIGLPHGHNARLEVVYRCSFPLGLTSVKQITDQPDSVTDDDSVGLNTSLSVTGESLLV